MIYLMGQPSSIDCIVFGPKKAFKEKENPEESSPKSYVNLKLKL